MSPYFTIYGALLLILQYVVAFRISFEQFHFDYDRRTMEQIGIRVSDFQSSLIPLTVKVGRTRRGNERERETQRLFVLVVLLTALLSDASAVCQ